MYIYDMKIFRRFIAILLLFSTLTNLISEFTIYGDISDESIGVLIITIFIFYLLIRKPKKKLDNSEKQYQNNESMEESEVFNNESRDNKNKSIFNNLPTINKSIETNTNSGFSPINDKETLITRIFKGKTDRIG
tara:strand:+ start:856 stop:1257 length:402 start_codon:yes stop_codon:yes gene_type:complete